MSEQRAEDTSDAKEYWEALALVIDSAVEELAADVVTLLLREGEDSGVYVEKIRRSRLPDEDLVGEPNVAALLRCFREEHPVLIQGVEDQDLFVRTPRSRDLVSFCSVPLTLRGDVVGMLNAYSYTQGHELTEGHRKTLAIVGGHAAAGVESAWLFEFLVDSHRSLDENCRKAIEGFATAIEESDPRTRGHCERVSLYSKMIADDLGIDGLVAQAGMAARVHDIGKIGIPREVLNKPGQLTEEELALVRTHPQRGRRILAPVPFFAELLPGVYCHHERFDGKGYPQGLEGREIPLLGRIIAVAESYDAMTMENVYRCSMDHERAAEEIRRCAGTQFDPDIASVFLEVIETRK